MSGNDPLIDAYLDRTMDARSMEVFSRRLADEPALAKAFLEAVRFDVAMRDQCRGEVEVDDLMLAQSQDGLSGFEDAGGHDHWLEDLSALEAVEGEPQLVDATDLVRERQNRARTKQRKDAALQARRQAFSAEGARPITAFVRVLLAAAAVALFVGMAYWYSVSRSSNDVQPLAQVPPPDRDPSRDDGVGGEPWETGVVLTSRSSASWGMSPEGPTSGEGSLTAGTYRLAEGVAELSYPGGAVVTVLAPAEIELSRRNGLTVVHGKVLCDIPADSETFQIDSGSRQFSSRGARLGMHVGDDQVASYVFAGTAEYRHGHEHFHMRQADHLLARVNRPVVVQADVIRPNDLPEDFAGFAQFARGRVLIAETFDEPGVLERFAVGQGYFTNGSTLGRAAIVSGRLELQTGGNNTLCCYLQPGDQTLPVGMRWVVDWVPNPGAPEDDQRTVFLAISTSAAQPGPIGAENPMRNGSRGFRLRWDFDKQAFRIEDDGSPPLESDPYDLECTGVPARLAIGRIGPRRFAFWVMYEGEDVWRLIGEKTHNDIGPELPISVGVEAFSWYRGRTFHFDNLRLESITD